MKTVTSTAPAINSKFNSWSFWLWLYSALSALICVTVLVTAGLVRHALLISEYERLSDKTTQVVIAIAEYPSLVKRTVREKIFSDKLGPLLMDRKITEQTNWVRRFPAMEDSGYLLFSGVDSMEKKSLVQLIRIADGHVMAHWNPDWVVINDRTSNKKWGEKGNANYLRAVHPLLLVNSDIIFNTGAALVRVSRCSSKPVFVLDQLMHHSVDIDENGLTLWGPSVAQDGLAENEYLNKTIRDDSLAHVSIDGQLLENRSFSRILNDNGLQAMLLGHFGLAFNNDPIHMNEIRVAKQDSRYWLRGDLLISSRNLSTLFLYRPSTNKILWHQTGPWMNQHSADFVDDHRISVFNNNVVNPLPAEHMFMTPGDTNRVMVYDFDTAQVTEPFAALLAVARPITMTAGRARLLPDGGLFLEETEKGRHLRFTADRLLWSRINDYDDKRIGMVSWSRYLTADEASEPLRTINAQHCKPTKANP